LAVNPGGEVDYSLARSVSIGIQSVMEDFEESFRANNLEAVKDTPVLPPQRLREAIATGIYHGGGRKYICQAEADEATNLLLNQIADTYQRIAGGALSWDSIILTGGGSALLYESLMPILNHENVLLADDVNSIHLANVRGGMKLWRLYEALDVL
jgi:aspartate/methionine/tyrosine aminotransferase